MEIKEQKEKNREKSNIATSFHSQWKILWIAFNWPWVDRAGSRPGGKRLFHRETESLFDHLTLRWLIYVNGFDGILINTQTERYPVMQCFKALGLKSSLVILNKVWWQPQSRAVWLVVLTHSRPAAEICQPFTSIQYITVLPPQPDLSQSILCLVRVPLNGL